MAGAVCEALCAPLGIEPPIYRRRVDFFTKSRAFDITRARTEIGYAPRVGLRDGIRRTLASGTGPKAGSERRRTHQGAGSAVRTRQVEPREVRGARRRPAGSRRAAEVRAGRHARAGAAGRARPRAAQDALSEAARLVRPQRRVRSERRAAPSPQDSHRQQRRDRRQLPDRRQRRRQSRHPDRRRRLRRPQHDPVVQERRHRARRRREHRLQLRGVFGEPRDASAGAC